MFYKITSMAKMGKFGVSSALLVMSVICLMNWTRAVQPVTDKDSAIVSYIFIIILVLEVFVCNYGNYV